MQVDLGKVAHFLKRRPRLKLPRSDSRLNPAVAHGL
jgi:hypothetical protein